MDRPSGTVPVRMKAWSAPGRPFNVGPLSRFMSTSCDRFHAAIAVAFAVGWLSREMFSCTARGSQLRRLRARARAGEDELFEGEGSAALGAAGLGEAGEVVAAQGAGEDGHAVGGESAEPLGGRLAPD